MLSALIGFLIYALIVLIVAYAIIKVIELVPAIPAPAPQILRLVVGIVALLLVLSRALPLLGVRGVF